MSDHTELLARLDEYAPHAGSFPHGQAATAIRELIAERDSKARESWDRGWDAGYEDGLKAEAALAERDRVIAEIRDYAFDLPAGPRAGLNAILSQVPDA